MSAVITPVPDDVFTALGNFLQLILGAAVPVIRGIVNLTAMPPSDPGFVVMTSLFQNRLATNVDSYVSVNPTTLSAEMSTEFRVQVDFYGKMSNQWAPTFSTLFRDDYACEALAPNCQPLYADDATMVALVDGEEQYEERWLVTAALQYNPVVTTPQQFADAASVILINVDEAYPP